MQKLRFNLFNQVHKALRARLFDTSVRIQQTDFSIITQGQEILREVRGILRVFEKYALIKDTIIFPLVGSSAPFVISLFEQEHIRFQDLGKKLNVFLHRYDDSVSETEKLKAGISILISFNEFVAFILQQMNKEETIINELLWANLSDRKMQAVAAGMLRQLSPDEIANNARWMIRGLNDRELINWLKELRIFSSSGILKSLLLIAEQELDPLRWELIRKEMDHLQVVAA